ncbi:hypothetical protein BSKO_07929 [Bryopsis sp. KO-2023]|nr:hypothetical protein BSKO_07929 [Bryopsis sp. KO-2023]
MKFIALCTLVGLLGCATASDRLVEKRINLLGHNAGAVEESKATSSVGEFFDFLPEANGDLPVVDPPKHSAGYFKLSGTEDAHMFYFFFQSRTNKDKSPLVLWTNGGPGCSSEMGVFFEQGPYKIDDDLTLSLREDGWDSVSNMVFIDQPTGTGFSYSSSGADARSSSQDGVALDVLEFMREFYLAHPDMADRDFYVTGESYAGHYVPAIAFRINEANKNLKKGEAAIKLAGIGIGNGLTNPKIQYDAYSDFAVQNDLISKETHDTMKYHYGYCKMGIEMCARLSFFCTGALIYCQTTQFSPILSANQGMNYYDIRKHCKGSLCYDFSLMDEYLNQGKVKKELGVRKDWVECSKTVYSQMMGDWMYNYQDDVHQLLEDGIRVLIYAGEKDLICNWLGNRRWVDSLKWKGSSEWLAGEDFDWEVDGKTAGVVKETKDKDLVFVKVNDAGHMVPMDQPERSLDMITRFLEKKSFKPVAPSVERVSLNSWVAGDKEMMFAAS